MPRTAGRQQSHNYVGHPPATCPCQPTLSRQLSSSGLIQGWLCSSGTPWILHKLLGACEGAGFRVSLRLSLAVLTRAGTRGLFPEMEQIGRRLGIHSPDQKLNREAFKAVAE